MPTKTKNIIKILISLLLVGWLIFSVNWKEVLGYLAGVNIGLLLLFVILYLIGIVVSAQKWKLISRSKDFSQPFVFFFKTYILGVFLNNFFPSFVGGDTYRSIALGRSDGKRFQSSASTVVFDRLSGLFAACLLGVVFGLLNLEVMGEFLMWRYFVWIIILGLVALFGLEYFWKKKAIQDLVSRLPDIFKKHLKELSRFREPKVFFETMLWSIVFSLLGLALVNYILFLAVGIKIDWLNYLSVIFFISIISSIPISIGNIGVKEWAYIAFFGIFGVSSSVAVTVVLLSRVIQLLVSLLAFPIYLKDIKTK
ncbi:MAG: flippase-like domain-containing protein [Candidatus Moranbacteria bacterium]|nr:flippase-like domain-containing protein [Candidatus Moranbacteria bacterium]